VRLTNQAVIVARNDDNDSHVVVECQSRADNHRSRLAALDSAVYQGDTKFWLGYIAVFILVTFFVTGLLQLTEWIAKLLKEPVTPIYLAAGGICAFLACLRLHEK